MLEPDRADWPLPPRPLVLPWPPPSPQPTRFFRWMAPSTFLSSWSFMGFSCWRRPTPPLGGAAGLGFSRVSSVLAQLLEVLSEPELKQGLDRGVHDGDVVLGPHRLREHVLDARGLEHGAHAAAGDEAGARGGRPEEHLAAVKFAYHVVRYG